MSSNIKMELTAVDREHVYHHFIRGRSLIYLEHNVWIDLEEGKAPEVLLRLKELKRRGRILCPLSFAAIAELLNQPTPELRERRARLMDDLSDGVIIRDPLLREGNELTSIFSNKSREQLMKEQGYSIAVEFLGDMVVRSADRSFLAHKVVEFCADCLRSGTETRSVLWLTQHLDIDKVRESHKKALANYALNMKANLDQTRTDLQKVPKTQRRERALHEMRKRQLQKYNPYLTTRRPEDLLLVSNDNKFETPLEIFTLIPRLVPLTIEYAKSHDAKVAQQLICEFFQELPTIELKHQYFVEAYVSSNYRKPKHQDFYDLEHLVTIPYVDYFVNADGYVLNVLKNTSIPHRYGCKIVPNVKALLGDLGSL